jgi:hypothetical protein
MFLFLVHLQTGAEVHEIIGAADTTNHAIPAAEELSQSLTRFARCGVLLFDRVRYTVASEFLLALRRHTMAVAACFPPARRE